MTTIVLHNNVIAYDSRCTNGGVITSDKAEKKQVVGGVKFVLAGYIGDFEKLISAYFDIDIQDGIDSEGPVAFAVEGTEVFLISLDPETKKFWKQPMKMFDTYALGSGAQFALGAIAMGADAVKAVKVAASLDTSTGGKIKSFSITKPGKKTNGKQAN